MAPIDYSKWDNIDTDSEPERGSQRSSAAEKTPLSDRTSRPLSSTDATDTQRTTGRVDAVIVRCDIEKRTHSLWSSIAIPGNHPIFSRPVLPIAELIEVPLVVHRLGTQSEDQAGLDNRIATYLNIDPISGFAPPEWQSGVGTVVVARKDRRPFLPQHLEGVWMFCDYILDLFGEGDGPPTWLYNRTEFEKWWSNYCEEQRRERSGEGGRQDPADWRDVPSLY